MTEYDVIIIGNGPTGKVLARQLVDGGHRVAIVDRWPKTYPLPRAIGFDHEILRMFDALGLAEAVRDISRPLTNYVWYNADWKVLIDIDQGQESISGGPLGYVFSQPDLERVLERDLTARSGARFFVGQEALAVRDLGDLVEVDIASFDLRTQAATRSQQRTITARYAVGCDGANSLVRKGVASEMLDHGFDEPWLVVDMRVHALPSLDIPDAGQWCNPARPTTIMPSGRNDRRWEFMLLPGEDPEEMSREDRVWALLSTWMTPQDGEIVRVASYRFRSLLAKGWRKERLLLAGDAAHQMPPFLGQGMCAGLRDVWNLGWKLDRVLKGHSAPSLLDTYEAERSPHVDAVIRMSIAMGRIICVQDPKTARERDEGFLSGTVPPPPSFPPLRDGLIARAEDGSPFGCAGALLPHDEIERDGRRLRLDQAAGRNLALVTREWIDDARFDRLGIVQIVLGKDDWRDVNGKLTGWLETHNDVAYLARPDFYAFGSAPSVSGIFHLIDQLEEMLEGQRHAGTAPALVGGSHARNQ